MPNYLAGSNFLLNTQVNFLKENIFPCLFFGKRAVFFVLLCVGIFYVHILLEQLFLRFERSLSNMPVLFAAHFYHTRNYYIK